MRTAASAPGSPSKFAKRKMANPAYQAFQLLHCAFLIIPIVAGLDKFYMRLANWPEFLWSPLGSLGGEPRQFMRMVGVIEIAAGLLVAFKPKAGGYVVAAWMGCIIINLLLLGRYYDVALRDLGLAFGALALARLSHQFGYNGHHDNDSDSD
jgi:hypothetical protein